MNAEEQFKHRLRGEGERVTSPRLAIFRTLARSAPISTPQIIARARNDGVDKVTVYRTLDLFRRLQLIREVGLGRHRLIELGDEYQDRHHHHVTCAQCQKITPFDSDQLESELAEIGRQLGFDIHAHQIEASGICRGCKDGLTGRP